MRRTPRTYYSCTVALFLVVDAQVNLCAVGGSLRAVAVHRALRNALVVLRLEAFRAGVTRNHADEREQEGDEPQEFHFLKQTTRARTQ